MERLTFHDAHADLEALLTRVHATGATVVLIGDYRPEAYVKLVPAGPETAGPQVGLAEARKHLHRLADQARRGETTILCIRHRPLARLVPLEWTGDGPEPERDPELWARINDTIDRYFADRPGRYTDRQQAAIRAMAAPLAYDLHTVVTDHHFAPGDFEYSLTEGAIWAAALAVR
jgi:antitoxin (DNA-binding transcriptional repressor) of toxin-antitoxin stability system